MKPISKIGKDASVSPLITDFRKFSNQIVQLFHDQPLVTRKIVPDIGPLAFDGYTENETATLEDMGEADIAMEPYEDNDGVEGSSIVVKTPQIFKTVTLSDDQWRRLFAGQARMPMAVTRITQKIQNFEDKMVFQGAQKVGLSGLISGLTHDLGNPTGKWGIDADGNGILENMFADVSKAKAWFVSKGIGHLPIDVVFTSYISVLADDVVAAFDPKVNNLDILRAKINGGSVHQSDNIQTGVLPNANTAVFIARTGPRDAAWRLLSSGFDQIFQPHGPWSSILGIREKASVEILNGDFIAWMDGIDWAKT